MADHYPPLELAEAKPANTRRVTAASVPPQIIPLAKPLCTRRKASPMALEPAAQAVTVQLLGLLAPVWIAVKLAAILAIIIGIMKGLHRLGPFVK
jgi:hypothetical protein